MGRYITKTSQKLPPADFHVTIDLRPVNSVSKPMTWPVPNLDSQIENIRESKLYASVNFPTSFWKLGLHEYFQHLHAFMAGKGVYMPTRTLQAGRNSAQIFRNKVAACFNKMIDSLKTLIDDFAVHRKTEQ